VNYFVLNISCRYGILQNLWNVDSKDQVQQLMLHSLKNMQIWVQQIYCDMNSTSLIDILHVYYNSISFIGILHIWCNFVLGPFEQHESILSTHYSHDMKKCNCFHFMASFEGAKF